jgi:hypothetical protein
MSRMEEFGNHKTAIFLNRLCRDAQPERQAFAARAVLRF